MLAGLHLDNTFRFILPL